MKRKNIFLSVLIVLICLFIFACTGSKSPTKEEIEKQVNDAFVEYDKQEFKFQKDAETSASVSKITFLSVNDFHGALEETDGEFGAARIGGFIIDKYNNNPNGTVILSAGDMFQGTGVSNYRYGRDVINFMNAIGFEAMTIGNHEFDWKLDTVLNYVDNNKENGEANFPFLGCNIVYKGTEQLVDKIDPYTIIEKGGIKIGVIGFMGYGLEYSIATSMIADYEFLNPVSIIAEHAEYLRTTENCDLVIAVGHDDNDSVNNALAFLSGNQRIDAIFNAHTHLTTRETIETPDGRQVPVLQGGSSGEAISEISFELIDGNWRCTNAYYYKMDNVDKNSEIEAYVNELTEITTPLFQRVLTYAGETISRYPAIDWCANQLRNYTNADVAFINVGGIRASGFPIEVGAEVTVASVYKIMPFDNTVKTVDLTGKKIISLVNASGLSYSTNLEKKGNSITINGETIEYNKVYRVAAIDYIFDKPEYPFMSGENIEFTGVLFRDVLIEGLEEIGPKGKWTL